MNPMSSHKDLIVWQKAVALATKVYAVTRRFPTEEQLGLNRELRRAAISIASHIADGAARRNTGEFLVCLHLARSALSEFETHIMIAHGQGLLLDSGLSSSDPAEIGVLLNELIRSLSHARQAAHAKACYYDVPAARREQRDVSKDRFRSP